MVLSGLGFRVSGLGFRVSGLGFRVYLNCGEITMVPSIIYFMHHLKSL